MRQKKKSLEFHRQHRERKPSQNQYLYGGYGKKRQGGGEEKGDHVGGEIEFGSTAVQDPFATIGVETKVGGDGTCVLQQSGCLHKKNNPTSRDRYLFIVLGWTGGLEIRLSQRHRHPRVGLVWCWKKPLYTRARFFQFTKTNALVKAAETSILVDSQRRMKTALPASLPNRAGTSSDVLRLRIHSPKCKDLTNSFVITSILLLPWSMSSNMTHLASCVKRMGASSFHSNAWALR